MASEQLHGIIEQPGDTCPMIDEAIKGIQGALVYLHNYEKMDEDEMRNTLWEIEYALSELVGDRKNNIMEDIRQNVIAIRHWGSMWKESAKFYYDHRA